MNRIDAPSALALGLAEQARRWCQRLGTSAEAQALLLPLVQALAEARERGHVCLPLQDGLAELAIDIDPAQARALLLGSGLVGTTDAPGACPWLIDPQQRLYLLRDFDHERQLAARLVQLGSVPPTPVSASAAQQLRALFAIDPAAPRPDWQAVAAALALRGRLSVISGGPGTGKTTTVARLLACLLVQQPGARIALAAPTGKAAARLAQALQERAAELTPEMRAQMPAAATTVHRLLGATPTGFEHTRERPLPIDILVVDEASMLDLALARRLFDAVPDHARVILLGDRDQLASVESGAVFAELSASAQLSPACRGEIAGLCGWPAELLDTPGDEAPAALPDSAVWLRESHRFAAGSGIAMLAQAVQANHGDQALQQLARARDAQVGSSSALRWLDDGSRALEATTAQWLCEAWQPYVDAVREHADDPAAMHSALARQRVLCAVREGPRGVQGLNDLLSQHLRRQLGCGQAPYFVGQPVLVLRNDPLLRLFNGDIGIVLPTASGELTAVFIDAADAAVPGARSIALARLPEHSTAFAMTVHKAQGSEFDHTIIVLPDRAHRVLSRQWLYTAVTRARQQVSVVADAPTLRASIAHSTRRHGGLLARIAETREPAATAP